MAANTEPMSPDPRPKMWRNVLFFVGSAAFGGLAVALWNRTELTQIQNEGRKRTSEPTLSSESEEEII